MKTIKIFLSSTFQDLSKERNFIKNVLIPSITDLFIKPVNLTTIDLRWGITDGEISSGLLLNRCIEAIDDCEPFFICLLGNRYGSEILEKYMSDYPEMLQRRKKLGYNLSATESEIAHIISKRDKGDIINPYFIFIEEDEESPSITFLHKLILKWKSKYSPAKLSNNDRLTILKADILKQFKDRVYICKRSDFEFKVGHIKHPLFNEISQHISSVTYQRFGNHSLQSSYFARLLNLYTQSNPFYNFIKSNFSRNKAISIFYNSNLLLESAITKILSESQNSHIILH